MRLNHPFGAVLLAWDKDDDVVYIVRCIRMADALPIDHAFAMKSIFKSFGQRIPVAWPQDAWQRREFDGRLEPLAKIYKAHGLKMHDTHATFPDGSNSTELGILHMQERFASSRLKVFSNQTQWLEEYRGYHRKDGQIVKLGDDLMSATRVGIMSLRSARPALFDPARNHAGTRQKLARGADPDAWGA